MRSIHGEGLVKPRAIHANPKRLYPLAKHLRQDAVPAEKILWLHLRTQRQASGLKFRRQAPLAPYIVDFVCLDLRLVVEIDGWSHDGAVQQAADHKRDEDLRRNGYTVLRFSDKDVMNDPEAVIATIVHVAHELQSGRLAEITPPPAPPARGGEKKV